MKNSVGDRIKITKKGRVMRLSTALSHNRAKKSKKQILRKKNLRTLDMRRKILKKYF